MVIFHGYVSLPEGTNFPCKNIPTHPNHNWYTGYIKPASIQSLTAKPAAENLLLTSRAQNFMNLGMLPPFQANCLEVPQTYKHPKAIQSQHNYRLKS